MKSVITKNVFDTKLSIFYVVMYGPKLVYFLIVGNGSNESIMIFFSLKLCSRNTQLKCIVHKKICLLSIKSIKRTLKRFIVCFF